jgi:hypothetical protein
MRGKKKEDKSEDGLHGIHMTHKHHLNVPNANITSYQEGVYYA